MRCSRGFQPLHCSGATDRGKRSIRLLRSSSASQRPVVSEEKPWQSSTSRHDAWAGSPCYIPERPNHAKRSYLQTLTSVQLNSLRPAFVPKRSLLHRSSVVTISASSIVGNRGAAARKPDSCDRRRKSTIASRRHCAPNQRDTRPPSSTCPPRNPQRRVESAYHGNGWRQCPYAHSNPITRSSPPAPSARIPRRRDRRGRLRGILRG